MGFSPWSRWLSLCTVSLLLSVACATSASERLASPRAPADQALLISSERLTPSMLLRQRLRGDYQDKHFELECVLQVSQGLLTIVGLTPFGSRAFVLTQTGTEHTFTKLVDRDLPFDPVHILEDVHRVFFRRLPTGPQDGERSGMEGQEKVTERWAKGVLQERTFVSAKQNPRGRIRVVYDGPNAPLVPRQVVIENGWYGYRLEIESVVQQPL